MLLSQDAGIPFFLHTFGSGSLYDYLYDTKDLDKAKREIRSTGAPLDDFQRKVLAAKNRVDLVESFNSARIIPILKKFDETYLHQAQSDSVYNVLSIYVQFRKMDLNNPTSRKNAIEEIYRVATTAIGRQPMHMIVGMLNKDLIYPLPSPVKIRNLEDAWRLEKDQLGKNLDIGEYLLDPVAVRKYRTTGMRAAQAKTRLDMLTDDVKPKSVFDLQKADAKIGEKYPQAFYDAISALDTAWKASGGGPAFRQELNKEIDASQFNRLWKTLINSAATAFTQRQETKAFEDQLNPEELDLLESALEGMLIERKVALPEEKVPAPLRPRAPRARAQPVVEDAEEATNYTQCPAEWIRIADRPGWVVRAARNPDVKSLCRTRHGGGIREDSMFRAISEGWNAVFPRRQTTPELIREWAANGITRETYSAIMHEFVLVRSPPPWTEILTDDSAGIRWVPIAERSVGRRLTMEEARIELVKHMLKKPGQLGGNKPIMNALTGSGGIGPSLNPLQDQNLSFIILTDDGRVDCNFYNRTPSFYMLLYVDDADQYTLAGISIDNRVQSVFQDRDLPNVMEYLFDKSCGRHNPLQPRRRG